MKTNESSHVRRSCGGRALLVVCAMLATACRSDPEPRRAERIDSALRKLCGDRYRGSIEPSRGSDAVTSGCPPRADEPPGIFAWFDVSSKQRTLTVSVRGDESSLPGSLETVTSALAPLLDAQQRSVVAQELPMLVPDRFRPYERVVNDVAISASTWTRDVPWERLAQLRVSFDVPKDGGAKPPMAAALETMGERFGWSDNLGALDAETLAKWRALCDGGEWTVGDVWARCRTTASTFWAEWTPKSRRLLRARIEARDDLASVVEPLVFPLLTDEQRAKVRAGLAADIDNSSESSDVYVRSEHGPDRHMISIEAERRW